MSAAGRQTVVAEARPGRPVTARMPVLPSRLGGAGRLAWRRVGFWSAILVICAGSGAFYGAISPYGRPAIGAVYGACSGGAVILFEQGLLAPRLRALLRRLPWLTSVLLTEVAYVALVVAGTAAAGLLLWLSGARGGRLAGAVTITPITILYALIVSGVVITMNRMRELIGAEVFRNILLGRYAHPVEEERIFLFIDLTGSTAYAQAHGDLRAQAYLGAIFEALAEPVRRHRGTIDDYVGDMALVSWTMKAGTRDGRCVACLFAFLEAIEAKAEAWRRAYGQVPRFRAALHGGSVVTAEVGADRHKIAYFGDVVNTTGRMEALSRTLDAAVLISADLLERLPGLPGGIMARPLGTHALKGRGQMLTVVALEAAGTRAAAA